MIKEEDLRLECPHCGKEFTYRHRYGAKPWDDPIEELEEEEENLEE